MSEALQVRNLSISFGGVVAVENVSFDAPHGQILSIIGPNGAGKTTLFNMVSGLYRPRGGEVLLQGEDITGLPPFKRARLGMARTFQNLQIFFGQTVLENAMLGHSRRENTTFLSDLFRMPSVVRQNARTQEKAYEMLGRVGLAKLADTVAGNLSYGSLKRLEIARALASEPEVLLLDEPAAGCNGVETQEIEQIIRNIAGHRIAIVLIEHDMKMVMRLSHEVLVLNQGRLLAHGTPSEIRDNPEVITAYLGSHAQEVDNVKS